MQTIDTVVIGAGHSGLALSAALTAEGREHVVIERGCVGEAWRRRRPSLTLSTPEWMNGLPGWEVECDPEASPTAGSFAARLDRYAVAVEAPVKVGTDVLDVRVDPVDGLGTYRVTTDAGVLRSANVVVATGAGSRVVVPDALRDLTPAVSVESADGYRSPDQFPAGGVLVIGCSASGTEIAGELARSGRRVVIAAGRHARAPRRYRGMDMWWWLGRIGWSQGEFDRVEDPRRHAQGSVVRSARRRFGRRRVEPGAAPEADLADLAALGVEVVGHWRGSAGSRVTFADDLQRTTAAVNSRTGALLTAIDAHVVATGLAEEVDPPDAPPPLCVPPARSAIDLADEGIRTVVLATGARQHLPWLRVPVKNRDGSLRHRRGATAAPGLYALGQPLQTHCLSGLIAGARRDAETVAAHIATRDTAVGPV